MRRFLVIAATALMLVWPAACSGSDTTSGEAGTETTSPAPTSSPTETTDLPAVSGPAEVTGEFYPPDEEIPGKKAGKKFTAGPCFGRWDTVGLVYRGRWNYGQQVGVTWLSDPRLVGEVEHSIDVDLEPKGGRCVGVVTGTFSVTSEQGSWQGTLTGSTSWKPPDTGVHHHELDYSAKGTGAYQGLRLTLHASGSEYPWSVTGRITATE